MIEDASLLDPLFQAPIGRNRPIVQVVVFIVLFLVKVIDAEKEEKISRLKIRNKGKPPFKVLDVPQSRLSINAGIRNLQGLSAGREFALEDVLPGGALTDVSLVGSAAADSENVYLARSAVISPEPETVPLIPDLFIVGLIKPAHVIGKVNVSDQIEFVQSVWREPSAENYLQQENTHE